LNHSSLLFPIRFIMLLPPCRFTPPTNMLITTLRYNAYHRSLSTHNLRSFSSTHPHASKLDSIISLLKSKPRQSSAEQARSGKFDNTYTYTLTHFFFQRIRN
jgi:hypothetical protein